MKSIVVNMFGLMALVWSEVDNIVGTNGAQLIGADYIMGGALLALLFMIFAFKVGVGFEAAVIFGTIFILWLGTSAITSTGNNLLSFSIVVALGVVLAFITFMIYSWIKSGGR